MSGGVSYTCSNPNWWQRIWSIGLTPWAQGHVWRYSIGLAMLVVFLGLGIGVIAFPLRAILIRLVLALSTGFGLVFFFMYSAIAAKMRPVRARVLEERPLIWADGLMLADVLRAPGIVSYRDGKLLLYFLTGRCEEVELANVAAIRETRWFNGQFIGACRGFLLQVPGRRRIGFAVADPGPWRGLFAPHDGARQP